MEKHIVNNLTEALTAMLDGRKLLVTPKSKFGSDEKVYSLVRKPSLNILGINANDTLIASAPIDQQSYSELIDSVIDTDEAVVYYEEAWDEQLSRTNPIMVMATNDDSIFTIGFAFDKTPAGAYKVASFVNKEGHVLDFSWQAFSNVNPIGVRD